jgi:DNA-binding MarR family transcriptional regulator
LWKPLLHAAGRVEGRLESELAAEGLSISKLGVLDALVANGEPLPLSRLAGRLACVKSNVTQLVDRLEADGLVRRVPDPSDRRSVLAEITSDGVARHEAGSRIVARIELDLFGELSEDDRDRLATTLQALATGDCPERT